MFLFSYVFSFLMQGEACIKGQYMVQLAIYLYVAWLVKLVLLLL